MKRFLSTACLLIGASVASFAGVITSASGTNLLGPSASLQNFDDPSAFPLGSFTSLPQFTLSNGVQVTISTSGPGAATSQNTTNTGSQARVSNFFNDVNNFGGTLSGSYLNTYAPITGTGGTANPANFVRTLTFTFSAGTTEFLIDYFGADSSANFFTVNGLATQYSLPTNVCNFGVNCQGTGKQIGFVADGSVTAINSISFTFVGVDNTATGGDVVLFDNLRVVGAASNGSNGTGGNGTHGGGEIPEPSTYALMGAGLLGLAYARRRKQ